MSRRGALVSIPAIGKGEPGSVPDAVLCPQGRGQFARGIRVARQAESEALQVAVALLECCLQLALYLSRLPTVSFTRFRTFPSKSRMCAQACWLAPQNQQLRNLREREASRLGVANKLEITDLLVTEDSKAPFVANRRLNNPSRSWKRMAWTLSPGSCATRPMYRTCRMPGHLSEKIVHFRVRSRVKRWGDGWPAGAS
jgi:hypothetical protein